MRFTLVSLILLLAVSRIFAQAPQAFNYQAVLRDAKGLVVGKKTISIRVSIMDSTAVVYQELFSPTTNDFGLFTLKIGYGSITIGTLSGINWGHGDKFLQVEMDSSGGTHYSLLGNSQLLSVPYALYAGNSAGGAGGTDWLKNYNDIYYNKGNVGVGKIPYMPLDVKGAVNADSLMLGYLTTISTKGTANLFVGYGAGHIDSGSYNQFMGWYSGYRNTSGYANNFIGYGTGFYNTTGLANNFTGYASGLYNTVGSYNTFSGYLSGYKNTTGYGNSYYGSLAGAYNQTGVNNSIFGFEAALNDTTGGYNTWIGTYSGLYSQGGWFNTGLGYYAGGGFTGSGNTFLGDSSDATVSGIFNATAIGYRARVSQSNSLVLGNGANVGVGTSSPKSAIHVTSGDVYIDNSSSGVIMKSPNGNCYRVTVSNSGVLTATKITCP